jgi:competence ComEA-like helix-hairpin-helix protein
MRSVALTILFVCLSWAAPEAAAQELAAGPGKEVVSRMCSNCHAITQATSGKRSKKEWAAVVDDMVGRGAEGTDDEIVQVIAYLARNYGRPVNVNTASAQEIEMGLSFSAAQSEAIVKHRTEKGAFKDFADMLKVPGLDAKAAEEQRKNIVF